MILQAIEKAGFKAGRGHLPGPGRGQLRVLQRRQYVLASEGKSSSAAEFCDLLAAGWISIPIISIEDGMDESDWDGWKIHTEKLGDQDPDGGRRPVRHQHQDPQARHRREDRQLHSHQGEPDRYPDRDPGGHRMAHDAGYTAVVSHRSGETEDTTIADLVVAPRPGRSRPAPCPAPTGWPSTTS